MRVNEPGKTKTRILFQFYSQDLLCIDVIIAHHFNFYFSVKKNLWGRICIILLRVKKAFKYQCWDILR